MAIRSSEALVTEIMLDLDTDLWNEAFLDAATALVDEHCLGLDSDGNAINSTAVLLLIETWLAAHFYAIIDPRAIDEKAGKVAQKFSWKTDKYLDATRYGQMAMTLDASGGLGLLNASLKKGKKRFSVDWIGDKTNWNI